MKKYWLIGLYALALTSCDSFLNCEPENNFSSEGFLESESDLRLYTNGFLQSFLPSEETIAWGGDQYADFCATRSSTTFLIGDTWDDTQQGGWGTGDWGNLRQINYFLDNLPNAKGKVTDAVYLHNEGVGRFWRAYFYYGMVRTFGDVPWYETTLDVDNRDELYKPRDKREVVMDKILEDLDFAIEHLPKPNETKTGNMHKYAALAFKSRACLYEASFRKYHGLGDYEELYREAADAAAQVIEEGGYSIYKTDKPLQDYYNLFVQEDLASNSECIMPRVYITKLLMHNNTRQMEESYTGLSRAMFEQYLCADGLPTAVSPGYEEADMPMDELMQRDPRLRQTIDNPELPFKVLSDGTKQFNALPIIDTKYCTTGYYVMKYHSTDPEQWNIGQSTLDVFIFRYAEVLLNYAEAKAELGECTQEVLDQTVNELRDRVEMPHLKVNVGFTDPNWPDYGYELSPLLYEIRRERAVELVGEGFRWDDIVRWKAGKLLEAPKSMLGMKVSDKLKEQYDSFSRELTQDNLLIVYPDRTTRKWDDKLYLHPLPIDETTMNPNLLPNNPGWE